VSTEINEAKRYLHQRRPTNYERDSTQIISREEIDAATTILLGWIRDNLVREFRFGQACEQLAGDAPLTHRTLTSMLSNGLLFRNARIYHTDRANGGAFRW
jgi:hypothetical protein